jgi:hypothetical protein
MTSFGQQLRKFRQQCYDAESRQGKLTQQRLGELLQREVGIHYSGAAVSDWERGESKISVEDRKILIGLVKVLRSFGGIQSHADANELLEAGNYRALNQEETFGISVK